MSTSAYSEKQIGMKNIPKDISKSCNNEYLSSIENSSVPITFLSKQNYPNPFNSMTNIEYELPHRATISIKIYNILGKEIITLENGIKEAGNYKLEWSGKNDSGQDVSSGIYIYVFLADDYISTKKMVLLK